MTNINHVNTVAQAVAALRHEYAAGGTSKGYYCKSCYNRQTNPAKFGNRDGIVHADTCLVQKLAMVALEL